MPRLVIVSVNDVYILDNFPRLATLIQRWKREPADLVIFPLAGDFVAPSLLSSIDAGRGMIDCMNAVGITHVVLGNHEDDIPKAELRSRLNELAAVCIGTNIVAGWDLPKHVILDVGGLKVGLVGVVMDDPTVYRGPPFGGAELAPANAAARAEAAKLLAEGCRAVIPITHQSIADDRALAELQRDPPFPAIIGGHEHTPMLVDVQGTWIVKAGMDAVSAVVTDIRWPDDGGPPTVTTKLEAVADYAEDPAIRARVDRHNDKVRELATATLCYFAEGQGVSSVGTRRAQTSLGALLCTKIRDCLNADACLFNGGGIRASRTYEKRLTYGDLEAEVPFDNEIVVAPLPGAVVRDAVKSSRGKAPLESGGFLQVDDRILIDAHGDVELIDGKPLQPEKTYLVALPRALLFGLDHVDPLVAWARANAAQVPPEGSGREPKMLLVQAFAIEIWRELGSFEDVDANHDEKITPSEIAAAVARKHPQDAPSKVLADLVIRALDIDADHVLTRVDAAAIPPPKRRV